MSDPDDGADEDPTDTAALKLALAQARALEPARREQLDDMIAESGWRAAARFAAYSQQIQNLALRPWQPPPCAVGNERNPRAGEEEAAALLRRMLDFGISEFHPNPQMALAAAQEREQERVGAPPMPESERAATLAWAATGRGGGIDRGNQANRFAGPGYAAVRQARYQDVQMRR